MSGKNGVSRTCKSFRKISKTQSGNEFKVLMMQKYIRIILTFG